MKRIICMLPLSVILFSLLSCGNGAAGPGYTGIYRTYMREFVKEIHDYAALSDPDFIIIPQNGQELLTLNGEADGPVAADYIASIDGVGREDLFYGYVNDNQATPADENAYLESYLDLAGANGIEALVTDYCQDASKIDDSYSKNSLKSYTSFAAPARELDIIPDYPAVPYGSNNNDIADLSDAANFLYLLNPGSSFADKADFLSQIDSTNYDILLIDLFYDGSAATMFTAAEISGLKTKPNGSARLVIAYMSIGEAEDYRFYWDPSWNTSPPAWLAGENPEWAGNYKVRYWMDDWKGIIYGSAGAYLDEILAAGFDGVYLDIIDAFEYFEN